MIYVSYTAGVISYFTTGKLVADHGISIVLGKDCALLRVLDGPICMEEVEEGMVARRPASDSEARLPLRLP